MASITTFISGFLQGFNTLRITSPFGYRQENGAQKFHNGVDIGVPAGTVLRAPVSGQIIRKRVEKNGFGLYLVLRHQIDASNSVDIFLAHLLDTIVSVGAQVSAGDNIAYTGGEVGNPNSGKSSGPHLHLECRLNINTPVDPLIFFFDRIACTNVKTGRPANTPLGRTSFNRNLCKTRSAYNYNVFDDETIWNETEYKQNLQKQPVSTEAKERLAAGLWQITKLLIDDKVAGKQVYDSGITVLQGSLMNWVNKVCQYPLVEFMGDTFGDQYYFIVRRPPFDSEGINGMYDSTTLFVEEDQILSTNLGWYNEDIYSWYQYIPYGDLLGVQQAQLFVPAVFFPEYAAIWGSRPLSVQTNYFHYKLSGREDDKSINNTNGTLIINNAIRDFKYLIESHAYLPFTRTGIIVLKGDRRYKRGTTIEMPWGELFYVDSVQQSFDISLNDQSRTTILQVSRGMYSKYISDDYIDPQSGEKVSYFNIIDFGDEITPDTIDTENWRKYIGQWKVNPTAFNFFMRRQQIIDGQFERDKV